MVESEIYDNIVIDVDTTDKGVCGAVCSFLSKDMDLCSLYHWAITLMDDGTETGAPVRCNPCLNATRKNPKSFGIDQDAFDKDLALQRYVGHLRNCIKCQTELKKSFKVSLAQIESGEFTEISLKSDVHKLFHPESSKPGWVENGVKYQSALIPIKQCKIGMHDANVKDGPHDCCEYWCDYCGCAYRQYWDKEHKKMGATLCGECHRPLEDIKEGG